jgi:deoxyinosine 3'endonuclease (endonuclease V)
VVHWRLNADAPADAGDGNCRQLRRVAGVDISFLKGSSEHACASIVVLAFPSLSVQYEAFTYVSLPAPYIAGFLAFREVPALTKLYEDLSRRRPGLDTLRRSEVLRS